MKPTLPGGCVFEYMGHVPEHVYHAHSLTLLEQAIYDNDPITCTQLIKDGHRVDVQLKIGEMSCIEYAAMKGYTDVLRILIESSQNVDILKRYLALDDVVDRAYMISRHKTEFFAHAGLAEANRYEAALFAAVEYNQPACVTLMTEVLGPRTHRHNFCAQGHEGQQPMNAAELSMDRGHMECYQMLCDGEKKLQQQQQQQIEAEQH